MIRIEYIKAGKTSLKRDDALQVSQEADGRIRVKWDDETISYFDSGELKVGKKGKRSRTIKPGKKPNAAQKG